MKNVNNFQIAKVQPQCVAWHLLDFLPISVWRFLWKCCLWKTKCLWKNMDQKNICIWTLFTQWLLVQVKHDPWKVLVKVFIVTKVASCKALTLLKLTLSQICFKNSAKITASCFRERLINVQVRSVLLVMSIIKRSKLKNSIFH